MLTGELRGKIDAVWNAFWAGGIANPIEVIEQITYLLFMRGLDDAQTLAENKANRTRQPIERRIFPEGKDGIGRDGGVAYADMRWSVLKHKDPGTMFAIVAEHVFPFLRSMGEEGSAHATHMKGARFTIPTPALLAKVVDLVAELPMEDRDTKGDLYEYMLSKIASAGQNGQFRTPRHIIDLMVEMTAPTPKDVICDPACGTCGFLFKAGEYLRDNHPRLFMDADSRAHFNSGMFHGFDFDGTMLRIGSMNMTLHGVEDPDIRYKDSLAQEHAGDADRYSLVLANPPFAGSLDYETTAKDLPSDVTHAMPREALIGHAVPPWRRQGWVVSEPAILRSSAHIVLNAPDRTTGRRIGTFVSDIIPNRLKCSTLHHSSASLVGHLTPAFSPEGLIMVTRANMAGVEPNLLGRLTAGIFDVDGVLLASPHEEAWRDALVGLADPYLLTTKIYQDRVAGRPSMVGALAALQAVGVTDAERHVTAYAERKQTRLEELIAAKDFSAFPDALRFVHAMDDLGWPMAAASSSKNANDMLRLVRFDERRSLFDVFAVNVCGRDLPRGKPDPAIFLLAAAELKVRPEHCFVVEDAPAGIQAARAGGMTGLGVARLDDVALLQAAGADMVVKSLDDVALDNLERGRLRRRAA